VDLIGFGSLFSNTRTDYLYKNIRLTARQVHKLGRFDAAETTSDVNENNDEKADKVCWRAIVLDFASYVGTSFALKNVSDDSITRQFAGNDT